MSSNPKQSEPYGYYHGNEAEQYTFYRLPKALFTNSRYKNISDGAKILYGLMLDRMGLSVKNGWLDGQDRVYIIFTLENVQEFMNCKHDKAIKMLAELDTDKGVGLIERIRQGQGRPAIIYIRKFFDDTDPTEVLNSEKPKSRLPDKPNPRTRKNRSQELGFSDTNKNDISNTDINDTECNNQSINPVTQQELSAQPTQKPNPRPPDGGIDRIDGAKERDIYREIIKGNIEHGHLCMSYDPERVTEILELMVDTLCTSRNTVRINQDDIPGAVVKAQFLKLNRFHIEYVFEAMHENPTKISNIKAYLLTTLYNAPLTIGSHYTALVAHDMASGNKGGAP
jgi:hypothetical protein